MATDTPRLPVPEWHRPGETWRVEAEPVLRSTDHPYLCGRYRYTYRTGDCDKPAVAIVRNNKGSVTLALCSRHLSEQRAWVENGEVVSWALRP